MTAPAAPLPDLPVLTMAKALNTGLRKAMEDDDKVVILGEDVGRLGGVFRINDDHFRRACQHDSDLTLEVLIGSQDANHGGRSFHRRATSI